MDKNNNYLHYEEYKKILDNYDIEYVPPICIINNPTEETLYKLLDKNNYLIKDGCGTGEGIVIKNYNFINRFGNIKWGKIVKNEFKEKHNKTMGTPIILEKQNYEDLIIENFLTESLIKKEYAKIFSIDNKWNTKLIPRLLNTIYYTLIKEESWNFIKKYKNPIIDYKRLHMLTIKKIKKIKCELFV